jgi:tetratricopeptide (TPR) repeat protein
MMTTFARDYAPAVVFHLNRGDELMAQGKLSEARQEFSEACKIDEHCTEAINDIGYCYLQEGSLDNAASYFGRALTLEPAYMPALNNMGSVAYRQHKYADAIAYYKKALSQAKNEDPEIHTNLANVLRDSGKFDQAIDHYRQAIKQKPDYANAYNNLGMTLYLIGRLPDALVEVTKATNLREDYAEAYYNQGLIYKKMGRNKEAIRACQLSLKYETNPVYQDDTRKLIAQLSAASPESDHIAAGMIFLAKQKWSQAEQEFRQAVNGGAGADAIAWNNLGLSLAKQSKYEQAISAYKKALSLKPQFAQAHYNLGQSLRVIGDLPSAKNAFKAAISDSAGKHALAHNALGIVLRQEGDLSGALYEYNLAIDFSHDSLPVAHFNSAMALESLNRSREAVNQYKLYLAKAPHGLNVNEARLRLKLLVGN